MISPLVAPRHAEGRFEDLYEVSRLLTRFEQIDPAVAGVLAIVTRSVRLRSAVLITAVDDAARTFVWPAADAPATDVGDAATHADEAYRYLGGAAAERALPSALARELPRQLPSGSRARVAHGRNYVSLPLGVDPGVAPGLFQLEGAEALDAADVRFASALSDQLAVALARHHAWRRTQTARADAEAVTARLRSLERVSSAALHGTTLDEVLDAMMPVMRDVFAADGVTVLLLDDAGASLRVRAALVGEADRASLLDASDAVAWHVVTTRAAMDLDTVRYVDPDATGVRADGGWTLMGAPLEVRGTIRGVVCAASRVSRRFTPDDVRLLALVADRIARVIAHSRSYDAERSLGRKLEATSRAIARIGDLSAPRDAATVLATILDAARAVTGARYASLSLEPDARRGLAPVFLGDDEAASTDAPARASASYGARLALPIRRRDARVGTVCLLNEPGAPAFTDHDERVVELLATHAGIALENARLYDDAQRAIRAREDVLAMVSHDLKNPLSAILLTAGFGLRHAPALDRRSFGRNELATIVRSARRMDLMIHDLLDAALIEAGGFSVVRRPEPLAPLLHEALDATAPLALARGLRARATLAPGVGDALCDRARVLQVLSNLLGNAIKFTPPGGEIVVSAEPAGDAIRVAVRDTGVGIAPESLAHVFDRYWRATSTDRHGSGLGLYIARGILAAHGSELRIESELGRGTVLSFTLQAPPRGP